jgi:hypothetical protein
MVFFKIKAKNTYSLVFIFQQDPRKTLALNNVFLQSQLYSHGIVSYYSITFTTGCCWYSNQNLG